MRPVGSIERYRFGSFELQPDKARLIKDGATISRSTLRNNGRSRAF
jgi:hypothetical protein